MNNKNQSEKNKLVKQIEACYASRDTYMRNLSLAKGYEVFKQMILLDSIECQGYVSVVQLQARRSFTWSIVAGVTSLSLVVITVLLATFSKIWEIDIGIFYITGVSGLLAEFISAIFFFLYTRSLERMDKFHEKICASLTDLTNIFRESIKESANKEGDFYDNKQLITNTSSTIQQF